MSNTNPSTSSKTKLKAIRVPNWLAEIAEEKENMSAELLELMELGAEVKYGVVFVESEKERDFVA